MGASWYVCARVRVCVYVYLHAYICDRVQVCE